MGVAISTDLVLFRLHGITQQWYRTSKQITYLLELKGGVSYTYANENIGQL